MQGLQHFVQRVCFFAAFFLLALAVLERVVNFFGCTILSTLYTPGRLLELAGVMLLFVITLLLRQIRESMTAPKA